MLNRVDERFHLSVIGVYAGQVRWLDIVNGALPPPTPQAAEGE